MASIPNRSTSNTATEHVADHNELARLHNELDGHAGGADPHGQYQKESEKGQANGYAALGSNGRVPSGQLGSGSASGSTVLHGDGEWKTPSGGITVQDENANVSTGVTQIDFQGAGVSATSGTGEVVVTIPGAGSAVVTAWKDVTKDPYNATGTGDETAKVQQAVDDASAASGDGIGVVFIPDRVINVTSISPKSNVWMVGGSWRAGLKKMANSANGAIYRQYSYQTGGAAPVEKFGVLNLQIDGNRANAPAGGGIQLYNTKHVIVSNCYIHDTAEGSIVVGDNADTVERVLITNNWCEGAGTASPLNFWGHIAATSGHDIVISNNICIGKDGNASYGIDIEPNNAPWGHCRRVTITGNILKECRMVASSRTDVTVEQVTFANNVVDSVNTAGGGAALKLENVTGAVLVSGNYLKGPLHTSPAIQLIGLKSPLITGNYLTGMGVLQNNHPNNVGIVVTDQTAGFITGNYIVADAATHSTAAAGIRETGTTANVVYGHNAMRNITVPGVYRLNLQTAFLEMAEQADPAAPAADSARLFARDNGSGKTQVCVRFATGAIQVLATEP